MSTETTATGPRVIRGEDGYQWRVVSTSPIGDYGETTRIEIRKDKDGRLEHLRHDESVGKMVFHRAPSAGPAVILPDGTRQFWVGGILVRED